MVHVWLWSCRVLLLLQKSVIGTVALWGKHACFCSDVRSVRCLSSDFSAIYASLLDTLFLSLGIVGVPSFLTHSLCIQGGVSAMRPVQGRRWTRLCLHGRRQRFPQWNSSTHLCVTCLQMLDRKLGRAHSLNVYFISSYLQLLCPPVEMQVFQKRVLAWGWGSSESFSYLLLPLPLCCSVRSWWLYLLGNSMKLWML